MNTPSIDLNALLRMAFVFMHVLSIVAAGAAIAFGDYAIFARQRIDTDLLRKSARVVMAALGALWLTGLTIIWLDIGFDWAALASKPKLLAKLTVVVLLSVNGVALHHLAFTRLYQPQCDAPKAAKLPAVLGAISVVTWLYAAFLGVAKAAAALLGYGGLMTLYGVSLAIGIGSALWFIRPRLVDRMTTGGWQPS